MRGHPQYAGILMIMETISKRGNVVALLPLPYNNHEVQIGAFSSSIQMIKFVDVFVDWGFKTN